MMNISSGSVLLAELQAWLFFMANFLMVTKSFIFFISVYFQSNFFSAFFIRPFYKMMLAKPITLRDMESVVSSHVIYHFPLIIQ